jgi:uncharacterized cupin superfamily protein
MKIVKTTDPVWTEALNQGAYHQQRQPLTNSGLGASLWRLPPGKKSFPFHSHHITEEALYVVSGTATVRTPDAMTPIGPGDFVSFEPGGPAHQLINSGTADFVYLGLSVGKGVDVIEYPDTGNVISAVGTFPNGQRFIFKKESQVGYFDGDQDAT